MSALIRGNERLSKVFDSNSSRIMMNVREYFCAAKHFVEVKDKFSKKTNGEMCG